MPAAPFRTTITGVSSTVGYNSSQVFFADWMVRPFSVSVQCVAISTGALVYTVEHSLDYTGSSAFISSAATWTASTGITAATTNAFTYYSYPVTAIRVQSSAGGVGQSVAMTIVSA